MTIRGVFLNPGTGVNLGTTLTYAGNFAGITDSPTGTLSFWWRSLSPTVFNATSVGFMNLLFTYPEAPSAFFTFADDAAVTPGFETSFTDGTATNKSSLGPGRVWVQDGNWHHIILSWDMNHAIGSRVYNCAIDRLVSWPVNTSGGQAGGAFSIPYSAVTKWQINHGNLSGGDIAELWFAPGVQLDVTSSAVLDKFATTGGGPVSLGSDGSLPTGSAPRLYLSVQSSTATDFLTNRGSGGGAFIVDPASEVGLALSDTDPAFDVPRLLTGSRSTLTMHTASFSGLDVSGAFPSTGFVYFGETSTGLFNGASLAIATVQPQFNSGDLKTPVTASFASLHDDEVNYDSAAITPPVAGSASGTGTFLMTKGASSVYLWQVNGSTPVVYADVFPLTPSITTIGPITVPITAWMTDQFTNLGHPQQMASMLWWGGKEQCVGLADSTPASGKVAMVDSAGTITNTSVWGGYTAWQDWLCRNNGSTGNVLLTIADSVTGHNYFIMAQTNGSLEYNTVYAVTADSTGTELSRAPIYCDDLDVESIVRFSVDFSVSQINPIGFSASPQGFVYLASDGSTTYLLTLNPQATTYTLYTVTADPTDAVAVALLGSFNLSSSYVDSQHWLLLQGASGTAILTDGAPTPPGVSITGVSATGAVGTIGVLPQAGSWVISASGEATGAGIGDVWMNDSYLDFSDASVRAKFVATDGTWQYMGVYGELPTGSSPLNWLRIQTGNGPSDILAGYGLNHTQTNWMLLDVGLDPTTGLPYASMSLDVCPPFVAPIVPGPGDGNSPSNASHVGESGGDKIRVDEDAQWQKYLAWRDLQWRKRQAQKGILVNEPNIPVKAPAPAAAPVRPQNPPLQLPIGNAIRLRQQMTSARPIIPQSPIAPVAPAPPPRTPTPPLNDVQSRLSLLQRMMTKKR